MLASELYNGLVHRRRGQAMSVSWASRSLFPALLEESEIGGREASRWGGNSHHCPLVQRSWSLDSKWAVYTQDQEEKSELGHKVVIIRFLKSHDWTETRLVECGSEVEPWPTNMEEQTWFLVVRPVQQWHELSCEVGRPCHEKCSESEDVWQGLCGSALVSRQCEDQFLPTHYY